MTGSVPPGGARPVLVFPGQGSQWPGMTADLLQSSPAFAQAIGECADALAPRTGWDLHAILTAHPDDPPPGGLDLDSPAVIQPVLWAVMTALAALWVHHGIEPAAVAGHSQGEIAAATTAGILTLDEAAALVTARSAAITAHAPPGAMASLTATQDQAEDLITGYDGQLAIATINSPAHTVISGHPQAVDDLLARCTRDGITARKLPVSYASHHPALDTIRDQILAALPPLHPRPAQIPFYSAVTGTLADPATLNAAYWYDNLRHPVQFAKVITTALADGHRLFIEASPHPVLTPAITTTIDAAGLPATATGTLRRHQPAPAELTTALAHAHTHGATPNWDTLLSPATPPMPLPTYPFQHQPYWLHAPAAPSSAGDEDTAQTQFWATVEHVTELAETLELPDKHKSSKWTEALRALAAWRRRHREQSVLDSWCYRITWAPLISTTNPKLSGTWLVLTHTTNDQHELVEPCAQALRTHGARVVQVVFDRFDREHLAQRLAATAAEEPPITGMLSLLALTSDEYPGHQAVSLGAAATFALMHAAEDAEIGGPLWSITQGAVSVTENEIQPPMAQVWGYGRVAALDQPQRWGGLIDLPLTVDRHFATSLCTALEARSGEDQIAIRSSGMYARRLAHAPLPKLGTVQTWKPHGTVLVTGGTADAGAHVARWLARQGTEHLVLSERPGHEGSGTTELKAELAALGTQATVITCDLRKRESLQQLLNGIPSATPLTTVIHTEGFGRPIPDCGSDQDQFARTIAERVDDTVLLEELLRGKSIEAFVLFASTAGVWGSGGQGAYAAANAGLEALAARARAQGLPATLIAWGPWGGAGISAQVAEKYKHLQRSGFSQLDPEIAVSALSRSVAYKEAMLVVADIDWQRFAPTFTLRRSSQLLIDLPEVKEVMATTEDTKDSLATANVRQRLLGLSRDEQQRTLLEIICSIIAIVLRHHEPAEIEPGRAFRDLGFDSLTAVELRDQLQAATGLRLTPGLVFDHPNPTALATYLRKQFTLYQMVTDQPVTADLEKLETSLAVTPLDEEDHKIIVRRLQDLLFKLEGSASRANGDESDLSAIIDAATDDEIFDIIDNQLK